MKKHVCSGKILCGGLICILLLAALSPAFAAGGKQQSETITVGLALTGIQTNSIFIDMRRAVEEKCRQAGYKLITADLMEGPGVMVTFLENCINAGAKVIIYQNIAEDAYEDILRRAKDRGIILGSYDNPTKIAHYTSMASNHELGLTIGRETGKWVQANPGSKKVAICNGDILDFLVVRKEGMIAGLKETCPSATIVADLLAGTVPMGVTAGENILQAHPDIQAVMGINDSGPVGVMEAFKAAGKSFAKDHIGLFGCDASEDGLRSLRENDMFLATVDVDVVNQVIKLYERCVKMALTGQYEADKAVVTFPMTPVYLKDLDETGNLRK
jgi:ABC-type sugar transport system substrate-binding protein